MDYLLEKCHVDNMVILIIRKMLGLNRGSEVQFKN